MTPFYARIAPGDGAIDIGANVGSITTQLAKAVGPAGHVLAVEPDARAAATCARVCQPWPWVTVTQLAVTARAGSVPLYVSKDSTQDSLAAANVATVSDTVEVACDTLDAMAAAVPQLSAIKIDAQGAEGAILAGAVETLQRPGVTWMVEVWPAGLLACGSSVAEVVRLFSDAGLSVLARGKFLEGGGMSWGDLLQMVTPWTGQSHTNILVGRS